MTVVGRLEIVPINIGDARETVRRVHRTHAPPTGGLFAVGLSWNGEIVGAAIVGRPVSRALQDDQWTAEVLRVAVQEGHPNGCSMLLGACWRAARALGWRRLVTYTLDTEPGSSLRAAGWREVNRVPARSWSCASRPRIDHMPMQDKIRWERGTGTHER